MQDLLLAFCKWLQSTSLGHAVASTLWAYPYVQLIHFSGLSLWVGTIVILDLRLLGLTLRGQSVTELADQLFPWKWTGLGIAVIGGISLFSATATTYFRNPAFRVKFPLVLAGVAYHLLFVQHNIGKWGRNRSMPIQARIAGFFDLAIWLGVITAAVNIPNY
jgi:Family of unknown function (DUF6644)